MKFVCQRESLLKEITLALDFTSQRNTLSIVSNVLIEAYGQTLTIKATDEKVGFVTHIEVETLQEGSTTVFCDKFLGILRALPDGLTIFEEINDKLFIHPENKSIDFELRTISPQKFPKLEHIDESSLFLIGQKDLMEMIDQTIFAISDDETRYFMNGAYLESNTNKLTMVATDGRRLSIIERTFEQTFPEFTPIIIPSKFLNLLRKISSREGEVSLSIKENLIFAKLMGKVLYSTLIKGQFPSYKRVIPTHQEHSCTISIDAMNEALKRVSLLVENKAKRVFLEIDSGQVTISSEESDFGQAQEIIPCDYVGPQCRIAMNYSYLASPLKVMQGNQFSLCFSEANKAVTVMPHPELDYFHIIMPMQID